MADSDQTRYYLGHVAGRLLILEIAHADAAQKEEECGNVKQSPIFRNITNAIPAIYRAQTWENTFYSLTLSLIYYIVHYLVTTCLEMFIFRHAALQPLAYAISSVFLCDIHFLKTGTAISSQLPLLALITTEDPNRFKHLAGPAFALGMSKALVKRVESMVKYLISPHEQTRMSMDMRAGTDVLIVMLVIAFRVVGILPGTIILTLTEASLLPPGLETVIPSTTKKRGLSIVELVGGRKIPPGLAGFATIMKPFRLPQLLWLIGLHLQKCYLQVVVELITSPLILAMVL